MLDERIVEYEADFDSLLKWGQTKTKLGQHRQVHKPGPNASIEGLHAQPLNAD